MSGCLPRLEGRDADVGKSVFCKVNRYVDMSLYKQCDFPAGVTQEEAVTPKNTLVNLALPELLLVLILSYQCLTYFFFLLPASFFVTHKPKSLNELSFGIIGFLVKKPIPVLLFPRTYSHKRQRS